MTLSETVAPPRAWRTWRRLFSALLAVAYPVVVYAIAHAGFSGWLGHHFLLVPSVTSVAFAFVFGSSLRGVSIAERFARVIDPDLSFEQVRYCRRVTLVWACFFSVNAVVIAALALLAPLAVWTVYTGLVHYLLAALLGGLELFVRVRRFGFESGGTLGRWLQRRLLRDSRHTES